MFISEDWSAFQFKWSEFSLSFDLLALTDNTEPINNSSHYICV